jgi:hypothetical protein
MLNFAGGGMLGSPSQDSSAVNGEFPTCVTVMPRSAVSARFVTTPPEPLHCAMIDEPLFVKMSMNHEGRMEKSPVGRPDSATRTAPFSITVVEGVRTADTVSEFDGQDQTGDASSSTAT